MSSIAVKVIRGVFGAGERLAPGLVGRAAFELFCRTPSPRSMTEGERRAVTRAAGFMEGARHHRLKMRGFCMAAHEFRPEGGWRGTVLVVHGWRSRTEYMRALIEGFRDAGFRVVSLDLPGHGASSGRRLTMVSAVDALRLAGEWFGPFAAAVGHSFGGAVAATATAGAVPGIAPLAADRLVLIAAPDSLPAVFDRFGSHLNVGPRSRSAVSRRVERLAGRPLADFVSSALLSRTPVPTLVVHAPDDREVPPASAEAYATAGAHVRLRWAPGLGHRRILSDADVVADAVRFVDDEPVSMH